MGPEEAYQLLKENKAVLVDVREACELRETGMAEGSLWMPCSKMDESEQEWMDFWSRLPKDKILILYCRSGARSGRLAEFLRQDGYETVNLGGFSCWLAANLPVKPVP